jgi:hypothetical protein
MTATLLPRMFALEINGKPTLVFGAKNLREAHELCREEWLRADLSVLASNCVPVCDAGAKLTARIATEAEAAIYRDAERGAGRSDDIMLVYLVDLDGIGSSDEQLTDPGAIPPQRT